MKVRLFTHIKDIDGIGCAVLARLIFHDITISYHEVYDINQIIKEFIDTKEYRGYEIIYITDLNISDELAGEINILSEFKNKIMILDHHMHAVRLNKYCFANVIVEDEKGQCSGTSLFYKHLCDKYANELLMKNSTSQFVELVRQQDTWKWKTKYNNYDARDLAWLFDKYGIDKFSEDMIRVISENEEFELPLNNIEYINSRIKLCEEFVEKRYSKLIHNKRCAVVFAENTYRNDIGEMIREIYPNNYDMTIIIDTSKEGEIPISIRSANDNTDVNEFAEIYGGRGHTKAAAFKVYKGEDYIESFTDEQHIAYIFNKSE
ncbi:MAG TPA: hypothetical protein DEP72_03680 [Clostridiales bacterium]|nr:MAG: hypothetical protein A2Y18_00850 [Clostridiales bacterium GWD2_32_19]HCC07254.1 hypothetical protein [Clostridiales bacterium]